MKEAKELKDLIYSIEPLAYYFGLLPKDFWNMTYKEVNTFCQANLIKIQDEFKRNIILQEAVTDKMIQADLMGKKPKIIPLKKMFKELFENKKKK